MGAKSAGGQKGVVRIIEYTSDGWRRKIRVKASATPLGSLSQFIWTVDNPRFHPTATCVGRFLAVFTSPNASQCSKTESVVSERATLATQGNRGWRLPRAVELGIEYRANGLAV